MMSVMSANFKVVDDPAYKYGLLGVALGELREVVRIHG